MRFRIDRDRLQLTRIERNITQEMLAKAIGTPISKIQNIERGVIKGGTDEDVVYAICRELNCSKEYLCGESDILSNCKDELDIQIEKDIENTIKLFMKNASYAEKLNLNFIMKSLTHCKKFEFKKLSVNTQQITIYNK